MIHSRVELPRIRESIKVKVSNNALPLNKQKISKKFSVFLPLVNIGNDNLKKNIPKNQRINKKSNFNDIFLNKIKRNIRYDSAVLNDPGKFYNGLFNG